MNCTNSVTASDVLVAASALARIVPSPSSLAQAIHEASMPTSPNWIVSPPWLNVWSSADALAMHRNHRCSASVGRSVPVESTL